MRSRVISGQAMALLTLTTIVSGEFVDPTSIPCGPDEYHTCEYDNGIVRGGGAVSRKCGDHCLCVGHPSYYGEDSLRWIDGKCVTGHDAACGRSTDGTLTIHCEEGTSCSGGRCRRPDFKPVGLHQKCKEDFECDGPLKCRAHFVQSAPLPVPGSSRAKRAVGPQYCCSARETEFDETRYTWETLPCGNPFASNA